MEDEKIKELILRCYKGVMKIGNGPKDPLEFTMVVGELFIRLCNYFNINPFEGQEKDEAVKQAKTER